MKTVFIALYWHVFLFFLFLLMCKYFKTNMVSLCLAYMLYLFFYFIRSFFFFCHFFCSPISRLDNPSGLQISLQTCLFLLCYSYPPNKFIHWIIQFQISGRLLKCSICFFLNYFYLSARSPPLSVLCEFVSLDVIDSGCSHLKSLADISNMWLSSLLGLNSCHCWSFVCCVTLTLP